MRAAFYFTAAPIIILSWLLSLVLVGVVFSTSLLPVCGIYAAIFVLAVIRLDLALCLVAACLPIFGDRPGTSQQYYLLTSISVVAFSGLSAEFIRFFANKKSAQLYRQSLQLIKSDQVVFLASTLVLSVLLSLFFIPVAELESWWASVLPIVASNNFDLWPRFIRKMLRSPENVVAYSFVASIWTCLCFGLFFLAALCLRARGERFRIALALSLLSGLLASFCAGILDYFKVISLLPLRPLDPIVNAQGLQFRMQSFFAHSGWFAEYLTFNIPFVLVILALGIRRAFSISIVVTLLVIGEFCLVLTYQRGGWLAYPISLLVVWISIYFFESKHSQVEQLSSIERAQLLKKKIIKVVLSIPVTILISFLLVMIVFKTGLLSSDYVPSFDQYYQRFRDISRTSDRTNFFEAAFQLGLNSPFFGNGAESFAWNYEREFVSPLGRFYNQIVLPLHGSAHNVYYQILSGQGLFGLLCLLLTTISAIIIGFKSAFFESEISRKLRLVALAASCALCSFMIYGNVQEFFYVQALQVNFFIVLALLTGLADKTDLQKVVGIFLRFLLLCIIGQIVFFATVMLNQDHETGYERPFGCAALKDKSDSAKRILRCESKAKILLQKGQQISVKSIVRSEREQTVAVSCGSLKLLQLDLAFGETHSVDLAGVDLQACTSKGRTLLTLESPQFEFLPGPRSGPKLRLQSQSFELQVDSVSFAK